MDRGGATEGEAVDEAEEAEADAAGEDEEGAEAKRRGGGLVWLGGRSRREEAGGGGGAYRRKKRTGPARSLSSMRCWSTRPKGLMTARVWGAMSVAIWGMGGRARQVPLP